MWSDHDRGMEILQTSRMRRTETILSVGSVFSAHTAEGVELGRLSRVIAFLVVTVLAAVALVPEGGANPFQMPGSPLLRGISDIGRPVVDQRVPLQAGTPPVTKVELRGTLGQAGWFLSPVLVIVSATDDVGVASTHYQIDDGSWQLYVSPFPVDADGNHTVDYFSLDREGNAENPKATRVPVDRNPPVFLTLSPEATVPTSNVVLSWKAEDIASGVAGFNVSVDGRPFEAVGLQTSKTVSLPDGRHTVRIRALDVAGNDAETEFAFHVDTFVLSATGPQATLLLVLIFGSNAVIVLTVLIVLRKKRS